MYPSSNKPIPSPIHEPSGPQQPGVNPPLNFHPPFPSTMYPNQATPTFPQFSAPSQPAVGIPTNSPNQYNRPNHPNNNNFGSQSPAAWSTGLFSCHQDCGNCWMTFFCPCVTFGRVAEIVDRGSTSCGASGALYTLILCIIGCPCIYSCFYRTKMRGLYNLEGGSCGDFCVHCCCEGCALCQEYRELKNKGFDMSLGWHGNVERNNGLAAPGVQGSMTR